MSNESGTGVYVYQQIVKTTAEWEADKTVPVENVWLFERRDDGKIITKLSDGQHCYSDLPTYGLSAWQAAQMGGYKGTEKEFYESLGTFDEKIKKVESLVASMSGKYAETPTLDSTPTEDTLTYTPEDSEEPRAFAIGQQCRVYEEDEEDYVFYQLYDIKGSKADWRIAGSGGTSAYQEKAVITLSSNQGDGDVALNGTNITVKYSDQTQELTWNGTALEVKVPVGMTYEISAGLVNGYTSPQKQSFTAVGGNERQVVFNYSCEKVTVNVSADDSSDCSGRTVTVKKHPVVKSWAVVRDHRLLLRCQPVQVIPFQSIALPDIPNPRTSRLQQIRPVETCLSCMQKSRMRLLFLINQRVIHRI